MRGAYSHSDNALFDKCKDCTNGAVPIFMYVLCFSCLKWRRIFPLSPDLRANDALACCGREPALHRREAVC